MSIRDYLPIAEQPTKRDNETRVLKKGGNLMFLDKSKELLTLFANGYTSRATPDLRDAARVGSEAIDRLEENRRDNPETAWLLLPSETERKDNEQ